MPNTSTSTSVSLTDLVRLGARMSADSNASLRDLHERDHKIATSYIGEDSSNVLIDSHSSKNLSEKKSSPKFVIKILKHWLDKTEPVTPKYLSLHNKEPAIALWMFVIGLFCGVIALSGLVFVDAKQPVNVLLFLTLFIGVQWVFLLLTLLVGTTAIFNLSSFHLPFENFNPAKLLFGRAVKQFSKTIRGTDAASASMPIIAWEYFSDVIRLSLLRWGQLFGVAFNLGALVAFFIILAFTDRNFGWSSTFNLNSESLFSFFDLISTPWKTVFPVATITEDIVVNTRYQFLQTTFSSSTIQSMRAWWPFLFAVIIFYGLLPRVILWLVFKVQAAKKTKNTFLSYPGVRLLLDRMLSPVVTTQSSSSERISTDLSDTSKQPAVSFQEKVSVINWVGALPDKNGLPVADTTKRFLSQCGFTSYDIHTAGLDLEEDKLLLKTLAEKSENNIVIAVKSWEPPLEELSDFVSELSGLNTLSSTSVIYLLLVPLNNKKITAGEESDWRKFASDVSSSMRNLRLWVLKGEESLPQKNDDNKEKEEESS
ncbi:MAG: DUF2868 domain-containing protein [Cellvibrionaceae bacterium]